MLLQQRNLQCHGMEMVVLTSALFYHHPLGNLELYTNCTKIQWCGLNPPALILHVSLYPDLDSWTEGLKMSTIQNAQMLDFSYVVLKEARLWKGLLKYCSLLKVSKHVSHFKTIFQDIFGTHMTDR